MSDLVGNPEDWFSHNEAHTVANLVSGKRLQHEVVIKPIKSGKKQNPTQLTSQLAYTGFSFTPGPQSQLPQCSLEVLCMQD